MSSAAMPEVKDVDQYLGQSPACEWPRRPRVGTRPGPAWYLLQARAGAEGAIRDFLKKFGYKVYYPKTLMLRPVPKRELTPAQRKAKVIIRRPTMEAIFPSYPFIHFDIADARSHDLFKIAGVYGLHCTAEKPVIVDTAFVAHLQALEVEGVIPVETPLATLFDIGETVRIGDAGGAWRGFNAVVKDLDANLQQIITSGRLWELDESMCATVGIELFGRMAMLDLPLTALEKT